MGGVKRIWLRALITVTLLIFGAVAYPQAGVGAYDTAYIFDHQSRGTTRRFGRTPLGLCFANGDTLLLNAGSKHRQRIGFARDSVESFVNQAPQYWGEGVRIVWPRGTRLCLQAWGDEIVRKYRFQLDTLFCIDSTTSKPWVFWNPIHKKRGKVVFWPHSFVLTNHDWAYRQNYRHPKVEGALRRVRYEYNAATGILTDNRKTGNKQK